MKVSISPHLGAYLVSEFRTTGRLVKEESDPANKLFYFSSLFGAVSRVLNIEYSHSLVLLYVVLQAAHTNINGRLMAMRQGSDLTVQLPGSFYNELGKLANDLADRMEAGQDLSAEAERAAAMAYAATGNGYYLFKIGRLRLSGPKAKQ